MARRRKLNPVQQLVQRIPPILRNKYFLVLGLFLFWMIFVDTRDMLTQFSLQRSVDKLEADKVFYEEQIQVARAEREELDINKERFAREKYFMQKRNEDVFIIPDQPTDDQ